jgi:hypothetical protein
MPMFAVIHCSGWASHNRKTPRSAASVPFQAFCRTQIGVFKLVLHEKEPDLARGGEQRRRRFGEQSVGAPLSVALAHARPAAELE